MHATHDGGRGREAAHETEKSILRLRRMWRNDAEESFIDAPQRIQDCRSCYELWAFLFPLNVLKIGKDTTYQIDHLISSCSDPS